MRMHKIRQILEMSRACLERTKARLRRRKGWQVRSVDSLENRCLLAVTVIDTNFNSGTGGVTLVGSAFSRTSNTDIVLTDGVTQGQQGSLVVNSTGSARWAFDAQLRIYAGGDASGGDGYSFGYGNIPNSTSWGEGGLSSGIWISVDTFVGSSANGAIRSYYNGNLLREDLFTGNSRTALAPDGRRFLNFSVTESGLLTYSHDSLSQKSIQLSGWSPSSGWRYGVGARTGGAVDVHVVDELHIFDNTASPTDIILSNSSVVENSSGATVGTLSTTDSGGSSSFTYALVGGAGSTNNSQFQISGTQLLTAAGLDFEAGGTRSVRIRTTDNAGLSFEESFSINVSNANDAPSGMSLVGNSVAENQLPGTLVGTLSTSDQDPADTFTYSLVSGTGSTDNANFQISGNQLRTTAPLNFEATSTQSIRIRTTDNSGAFSEGTFSIGVQDLNDAPTDIQLSAATVSENSSIDTEVGLLTTSDEDANASFTYQLVSGTGATDNSSFEIVANSVRTRIPLDFETKSDYSVRVRSSGNDGLTIEKAITISVVDVDEIPPKVSETSFLGSNTIVAGATQLTVTFSESVVGAQVASNYELLRAGADGLLGTTDDSVVNISSIIMSGNTASLNVPSLPDDLFSLKVKASVTDNFGNRLDGDENGSSGGDWQREFSAIVNVRGGNSIDFSGGIQTIGTNTGFAVNSVASGDFDADGKLDFVAATADSANYFQIYTGLGNGAFTAGANISTNGTPLALVAGDVTGDGLADVVVARSTNEIAVFRNIGAASFASPVLLSSGGTGLRHLSLADINGDGKLDILLVNETSNQVGLLRNTTVSLSNPSFASVTTFSSGGTQPSFVTTGEFNGDGSLDLVVANSGSNTISLFLNQGNGAFGTANTYDSAGAAPVALAVGDFNDDGSSDLAIANRDSFSISVLVNAGGFFRRNAKTYSAEGGPRVIIASDLDLDGRTDLLVGNATASVSSGSNSLGILRNLGAGKFGTTQVISLGTQSVTAALAGDFDIDGRPDIVTGRGPSSWGYSFLGSKATAGSLDVTFSQDGKSLVQFASTFADVAHDVAIQNDGKVVLAGLHDGGAATNLALVRYNSDGSLDTSFGGGGRVSANFGTTFQRASAVQILPDGKIVTAGFDGLTSRAMVNRFNRDGSLDRSFGFGGIGRVATGPATEFYDVKIQADGKIVAVGLIQNPINPFLGTTWSPLVARFTADGLPDTSFDSDGWKAFSLGTNARTKSVAIQPDGKIIVGASVRDATKYSFTVLRLLPNGTLDPSFGSSGTKQVRFSSSTDEYLYATALQQDGKIVVGGSNVTQFAVARLNVDGSLDSSFSDDGRTSTGINGSGVNEWVTDIAITQSGEIIAVGTYHIPSSNYSWGIVRYRADGSLDTSFDGDGKRTMNFGGSAPGTDEGANGVAIQSDGDIVAAGYGRGAGLDFAIARVNAGNHYPTNIQLSSSTISENNSSDATVGTFSTSDGNATDTFTYSLVSGVGADDNAAFFISGNALRVKSPLDFESDRSHRIRVRSADPYGAAIEKSYIISVADINEQPFGSDSSTATSAQNAVAIHLNGVDPEGASLIYTVVQGPHEGTLSGSGANRTYTPHSGHLGIDEFSYTVSDGVTSSPPIKMRVTTVPVRGTATLSLSNSSVAEGQSVIVSASISEMPAEDIVIPLSFSGTAIRNRDYAIDNAIIIRAGETSGSTRLVVQDDLAFEGSETIILDLDASAFFVAAPGASHSLTVTDNDPIPEVSFQKASVLLDEVAQSLLVGVILSAESETNTTIPLVYSGTAISGVDFAAPSSVMIPAGSRSVNFTLSLVDDLVAEATETIRIQFGAISGGIASTTHGLASEMVIFVAANDKPVLGFTKSSHTVSEGIGSYTLEARLEQPSPTTLTVPFSVSGTATSGTDFASLTPTQLVFAPGQTSAFVTIIVTDDTVPDEATETVSIKLTRSLAYEFDGNDSFTLQIEENDNRFVSLTTRQTDVWENAGTYVIEARLSAAAVSRIEVPVTISDDKSFTRRVQRGGHFETVKQGFSYNQVWVVDYVDEQVNYTGAAGKNKDFQVSAEKFVFEAGVDKAYITVTLLNDTEIEKGEYIELSLNKVPGVQLAQATARIELLDDDAEVSFSASDSVKEVGGNTIVFTASMSKALNRDVVIPYSFGGSARGGTDYTAGSSRELTIPAGGTSAQVTVVVRHDTVYEGNETIDFRAGSIQGALLKARSSSTATGTIIEDDGAPSLQLYHRSFEGSKRTGVFTRESIYKDRLVKSDTFEINEKGGYKTFRVYKEGQTDQQAEVAVTLSGASSEFYVVEGLNDLKKLVIPAGYSFAEFTVRSVNNNKFDGNRTLKLQLSDASNAVLPSPAPRAGISIIDDDSSGSAGSGGVNVSAAINGQLQIKTVSKAGATNTNVGNLTNSTISSIPGSLAIGNVEGSGNHGLLGTATVFFDSNFNGIKDWVDLDGNGRQDENDPDELSTTTGLDGSFFIYLAEAYDLDGDGVISPADGRFVLTGGDDTSTGLPWRTTLRAPVGMSGITPLTTLAESLVRTQAMSANDAANRLTEAIGIDGYSLANSNPLYEMADGSEVAVEAYRQTVKLYTTAIQLSELMNGITGGLFSIDHLATKIFDAIARQIATDSSDLNLSLSPVIGSLIRDIATQFNVSVSPEIEQAAINVIGAHTAVVDTMLLSSYASPTAFISALIKVKKQAYGPSADAMRQLGIGTLAPTEAVSQFTGASLDGKIAAQTGGFALPPVIVAGEAQVREGNDGQRTLTFEITLTGEHDQPASVHWRTADGTAILADHDYEFASGILTWAAGNNDTKTVSIVVHGDANFEADEYLKLQLVDSEVAVAKTAEAIGLIYNDDGFSVSAESSAGGSHFYTLHTNTGVETTLNQDVVLEGTFVDPLAGTFTAPANSSDSYTLDFYSQTYRGDNLSFAGGNGTGTDSWNTVGGKFDSVHYVWLNENSGSTRFFTGESIPMTMQWSGLESVSLLNTDTGNLILQMPSSITDATLADADVQGNGVMRIFSPTSQFAPLEFANPSGKLVVLFESSTATLNLVSTDPDFSGELLTGAVGVLVSSSTVAENGSNGEIVGQLSMAYPDASTSFEYSLVSGSGDNDNSSFSIEGNVLKTNGPFDFEASHIRSVRVRATDAGGLTFENTLVINISNVNETPAGISLTGSTVAENQSIGIPVGTLTTSDPDAFNTFTYSFVTGTGDGDNASFTIDGSTLKTAAAFDFETKNNYTVRVRSTDAGGLFFERSFTISVTDVEEDLTAPISQVSSLPSSSTSLSIPISVTGTDPGTAASGIKEYDLFVAIDSGAFTKFATVPANSPSTVYAATSNHTYFFRSVARDNAGNVEVKPANYADAFIRVADLDKPVTQVTSANANSAGVFSLAVTGGEVGGSQLAAFDLYVSIDNATPVLIGSVSGGTPVTGVYSGTTAYQGLADGVSHTYRFYSRGRDSVGNVEDAPSIGDVTTTQTFAAPAALQATGIDVQNGAKQRAYITKMDLLFNTATGVSALTGANRIKVERFGLLAGSVTPGTGIDVPIGSLVVNGSKLSVNFGSALSNDGFYRIRADVNGDGDYDDLGESFEFHRLLGDANGDAIVNSLDTAVVDSLFGRVGTGLDGDLNGDGIVNTSDKSFTLRSYVGRKLSDALKLFLDD